MLVLTLSFTLMIKPKLKLGSAEDLKVLGKESQLNVKFDYSELMVNKFTEKEWVATQRMKDIEDEKKATEEFNKYWYTEIVPLQEEKFMSWYNANCKEKFKIAKNVQSKYTMTVKPTLISPSGGFATLATLTSDIIISETSGGKVIAIINIANVKAGVPALKERVSLVYGAAAREIALFIQGILESN